jgi:hypothetical protein
MSSRHRLSVVVLLFAGLAQLAHPVAASATEGYFAFINPLYLPLSDQTTIYLQAYTDNLCLPELLPPTRGADRFLLTIERLPFGASCGTGPVRVTTTVFGVGALPPGTYTLQVVPAEHLDQPLDTQTFTIADPGPTLKLQGDRFLVNLEWTDPTGAAKVAHPVRLTDESAYFWFFDPANAELTLKLLDGQAVNGHFWLFLASMTDLPFTLTVIDLGAGPCSLPGSASPLPACPSKRYVSSPRGNRNFIDLNAFGQ